MFKKNSQLYALYQFLREAPYHPNIQILQITNATLFLRYDA